MLAWVDFLALVSKLIFSMTRMNLMRRLRAVMTYFRALRIGTMYVWIAVTCCGPISTAQATKMVAVTEGNPPAAQQASPAPQAGVTISLDEAIRRAQTSDPSYRSAVTDRGVAGLDHSLARSALLPGVVYHNQFVYTSPGQLAAVAPTATTTAVASGTPIFIANNSIHEYVSQASITETVGAAAVANLLRTSAAAAVAVARQEVARRGLIAAVMGNYYGLLAAREKLLVAGHAAEEATRFGVLTRKLENGGEVAHADVVKSDLQKQQRERDLADAQLAAEKARLDLAVLLFPDPRTIYTLAEELSGSRPLPDRATIDTAAQANNPDLRGAMAALRAAGLAVTAARATYLPDLGINFSYGIDAPQFAVNNRDHLSNLGYSATVTLDIPVWDWFATHDRVKQDLLRRDLAQVELSSTQRRLIASLDELFAEARVSRDLLDSLDLSVQTARESLRLVNLRYAAGEATVLEVVDAQAALVGTETAKVDGAVRYRAALANLQTLTGTLP